MLDNITKKNIDDCRDVLVGKVPDPKSQIEQITLALIYKFMDDMDKEAVEKFKGKAKFFAPPKYTGNKETDEKLIDYSKYGWRKLFDPSLSGVEMLTLYADALEKLNTNPNIPELFRNIFKNAYLPYRDPSTLKLFLKYINEFEYSHSEKLGDAFEYLLSVMGSQGDAGQFRTPRHIIDFVTACVNPQKNETVLDPACGTAGFLLSAYKHILNQNSAPLSGELSAGLRGSAPISGDLSEGLRGKKTNSEELIGSRPGSALSPDDRKKLATNFVGYDISPDMVRLSLANMYLHGFTTPLIHEYDSLSSEDRWQETFDVILANPPFMTPKGGIRPHKKFGVQANKAEVLFTDYIAEHLNSNGRAGIVVPNGIVATSQTAYKQLRKVLVQDSLIAVISLPAGVFQPYSGVKTSVLILDKRLAKKSQHILFLKIENDGFDLGAQRREIDKNDLPKALQTLEAFKVCLSNDKAFEDLPLNSLLVEKKIIIENKDIALSPDKYIIDNYVSHNYEMVRLGDCIDFITGLTLSIPDSMDEDGVPIISMNSITEDGYITEKGIRKIKIIKKTGVNYLQKGDLLFNWRNGSKHLVGKTGYFDFEGDYVFASFCLGIRVHKEKLLSKFLWRILNQYRKDGYYIDKMRIVVNGLFNRDELQEIEIPLPPLEIQQQIVAEIEGYQKIIDGAKQVVNNYKPTITINPDWEMVDLGDVFKLSSGRFLPTKSKIEGSFNVYGGNGINGTHNEYFLETPTLVIGRVGEYCGAVHITTEQSWATDNCLYVTNYLIEVNQTYLMYALIHANLNQYAKVGGQPSVSQGSIYEVKIPLPPIEEQQTIVNAIEEELQLVNANKRLIEIFEQKIKTKIAEVWGVKEEENLSIAAEPSTMYNS